MKLALLISMCLFPFKHQDRGTLPISSRPRVPGACSPSSTKTEALYPVVMICVICRCLFTFKHQDRGTGSVEDDGRNRHVCLFTFKHQDRGTLTREPQDSQKEAVPVHLQAPRQRHREKCGHLSTSASRACSPSSTKTEAPT